MALKVVIVEDEEVLCDLLSAELKRQEFEVYTAIDGGAGWQLIQEVKPDIILLDLLMPVMSGYDVLAHLRANQETHQTPCIVISNSGQTADLNRAFAEGADDVLIKAEFNPDQVVQKVKELLEKKHKESLFVAENS
jgi:DNA-binding response OmpR family regulator